MGAGGEIMTKHTPGPWFVKNDGSSRFSYGMGADMRLLCQQ